MPEFSSTVLHARVCTTLSQKNNNSKKTIKKDSAHLTSHEQVTYSRMFHSCKYGSPFTVFWMRWHSHGEVCSYHIQCYHILLLPAYSVSLITKNAVMCTIILNTTTVLWPFFPGPSGWAGARRELLDFMVQGKIKRGRHTDHPAGRHSVRTNQCPTPPSPISLQARCPSCCPTNSVKALKATSAFGLRRKR